MNFFLLLLFVFIMDKSFCQTTQSITLSKTDYFRKSKEQKTAGLILLASGTTIATIGIVKIVARHRFLGTLNKEETFWVWASAAGLVSDVVGISLLTISHRNKSKAKHLSVSLGTNPLILPQQNKFLIVEQPMVTLKINIGH